MKVLIVSALALVLLAGAFFGGAYWERYSLLTRGPLQLTRPVTASVPSGEQGLIPKGATLYPYQIMGETSEYVLFVELKERDILASAPNDGRATLSPVHAYPQPAQ